MRLDVEAGVATLTLCREKRMNAFDEALHAALADALQAIRARDDVRVLILTGSGRAFSAGQDLVERRTCFDSGEVPDLRASLERNYNALIRALAALPIPVIAAVNGVAFGAGAALAIACDIVCAAESARFQFGFVNVGLGPDSGASWFLPRAVGLTRALDLALTGRAVSAREALEMGVVSRVTADADLLPLCRSIATDIAGRSGPAVAAIKARLREGVVQSLDSALDAERDTQADLGRTEFYREAVLQFSRPK